MHIAIEGMDGVGKTTVARLLSTRLGFDVVEKPLRYLLDEPGETANYVHTRDYINQQVENDPLRAWFYGLGNVFLYHRFRGRDVITDRHFASNYFWCGGPGTEDIFKCMVDLVGKPEHTFLLHASLEEATRRIRGRDAQDPDLEKAALGARARQKMESFLVRYDMPHTVVDTTSLRPEEVVDVMLGVLRERGVIPANANPVDCPPE
ncbi:hypothetical protein CMK11_02180 [Candidatus Poribacteria bacterium]|jgi:thymidylate kinase|nr:hypothetical protein [Candidatus Poribacteria bacterium]